MNGKKKQETKKEKVNDSVKKDEEEESRVKQKGKKKKLKLNRKLYEWNLTPTDQSIISTQQGEKGWTQEKKKKKVWPASFKNQNVNRETVLMYINM